MSKLLTAAAAAATVAALPDRLNPALIRRDGGTQMRAQIDAKTLAEYEQMIRDDETIDGWPFKDKPVVFYDGSEYWLGDGFHRHLAWTNIYSGHNENDIPIEIRSGTRRDAVLYAAGSNADHGLRRTSADKQRSVLTLLHDDEWRQWSNREIARRCKVDEKTVRNLRESLTAENPQSQQSPNSQPSAGNPQMRKFERNGRQHEMKVPERKTLSQSADFPQTAPPTSVRSDFASRESERARLHHVFQQAVDNLPAYTQFTGDDMTRTLLVLTALVKRLDLFGEDKR